MEEGYINRRCETCNRRYSYGEPIWRCDCRGILVLDDAVPFVEPVPVTGIWRYHRNLPQVLDRDRVTLGEGGTPLVEVRGFTDDVHVKLEFALPTGSFKDRGTTVMVSRLKQIGIADVVEDSSGNAGVSVAAYCAAAGIRCRIYVPASASNEKLTQIRAYGTEIMLVPGTRAAATEAALSAAGDTYYANHAWDPYFLEGIKTVAFEIAEQLGWRAPRRVIFPLGQGTMLLGLAKGFRELLMAGRIQHVPQLIAVQTDACAPIYEMLHHGLSELPILRPPAHRILAEGIAVAAPIRWRSVMRTIRENGGEVIRVPEAAIPSALSRLGKAGFFVEPTSATVLAALDQRLTPKRHSVDGPTVLILTASGLKASATVQRLLEETPQHVESERPC